MQLEGKLPTEGDGGSAGGGIHAQDGILDESFDRLISHLGELVCIGMSNTNDTIVHIMKDEKMRRPNC